MQMKFRSLNVVALIKSFSLTIAIILLSLVKTTAQFDSLANKKDSTKVYLFDQKNTSSISFYEKNGELYTSSLVFKYSYYSGLHIDKIEKLSLIKYKTKYEGPVFDNPVERTVEATIYHNCSTSDTSYICKEGDKIDLVIISSFGKTVWQVIKNGSYNSISKVSLFDPRQNDKIIESEDKYYLEELPNNDYLLLGFTNCFGYSDSSVVGKFYYSVNGSKAKEVDIRTKNRNLIQDISKGNYSTCKIIYPTNFKAHYNSKSDFCQSCQEIWFEGAGTKSIHNTKGLGLEVTFSYKKNNKWIDKKVRLVINNGIAEKDFIYID